MLGLYDILEKYLEYFSFNISVISGSRKHDSNG